MFRKPQSGKRLAAPAALLAGALTLAALVLMTKAGTEARADAPKVTAGFQTSERLLVQVQVPPSKKANPGDVEVELIGPDGKVLQQRTLKATVGESVVGFDGLSVPAEHVLVRVKFDGRSDERRLGEVLLAKPHETTLSGPTELHSGSSAELRCAVTGARTLVESVAVPGAAVVLEMSQGKEKWKLFSGKTDATGEALVKFQVPEVAPGDYTLTLVTRSALGADTLSRVIKVVSDIKVLLTTDKPIYQPGQIIRVRALSLQGFDLRPVADKAILVEIEDGKANKVFKKELKTSAHGIASVDFTLADEVNMGDYRIRAVVGPRSSDKTVNVKRYVLPKFKSSLVADKKFYLPKETIKGTLQVDYFFGKPVSGGSVEIKASTFDVAFREFSTFKGQTDKNGHVAFEIKLPDYFVGLPLTKGDAIVRLEAKVTDAAEHAETTSRTFPVSDKAIRVSFMPEGGRLVPEMTNRVFVAALYPDGSPANCNLEVFAGQDTKGKKLASLKTNAAGLAELEFTPAANLFRQGNWGQRNIEMLGGVQQRWGPDNLFDLCAEARDANGATALNAAALTSEVFGENVVLRLDKAVYKGGDRLKIDVRSSAGMPSCYLDVVKSGQSVLTRMLDVKEGKASSHLDLPASVFGTMEVHVYQVLQSGEIVRDSRVVYVNQADSLKIDVTADKTEYRPGEDGVIRFVVTDAKGKPAPAALGVIIVDEAVYALQEMQPGLEKVYFTLQEELLKPRTQVVFKPREGLDEIILQPAPAADRQQVAAALLTVVKPKAPAVWRADPAADRLRKARERVARVAAGLFQYAERQQRTVLELSKDTAKWTLQKDVLARAFKAGNLNKPLLADGLGGDFSLTDLARLQPGFTAESFAKSLTEAKLINLMWPAWNHANADRKAWLKNDAWHPPEDGVDRVAKTTGFKEALGFDAWGRAIKFAKRKDKESNPTGIPLFDKWDLVSAGPDGKFGTADDVKLRLLNYWNMSVVWFLPETNRNDQLMVWRDRLGRNRDFDDPRMLERAGFPGMPLPGGPVPKMVKDGGFKGGQAKGGSGGKQEGGGAPPRLREHFPETLLWQPALITDERGRAELKVPFADSITTWRLTASGSSKGGLLGGTTTGLKVFQDFFVDIDLPVALTRNDEVAFPVAVYNYLKGPQTVTLTLKQEPWFTLLDSSNVRTLKLEANQVTAIRFRIKANKVGYQPLQVEARGTKMSDAVKRLIEIAPDGRAVEQVFTDRLKGEAVHTINLPGNAIEGASRLFVKVYPGVHSQLMEGAEAMMRMPNGCFEQTSSSAYPNILVTDYLKRTKQGSPASLLKAETYLAAGYQRLLTFERPGGGFDWWGSGEPLVWLSAYGLQEFSDMAKVYPVDKGIIDRTVKFLFNKQNPDGTWDKIGATHGVSIEKMGDAKLLLTSYVAWSILESMPKQPGWEKTQEGKRLAKAVDYIREHAPKADNAYVLALAANALACWDAKDDRTFETCLRVLRKLQEKKERKVEWKAALFPAGGQSLSYAREDYLTTETTALAVLAMVKNGQFAPTVNESLTYLIKSKESSGAWGSTQATILALKALIAGAGGNQPKEAIAFAVKVGGNNVAQSKVTPDNHDVMQQFDLREHLSTGANEVRIQTKGETGAMYQIVGRHFVPLDKAAKSPKSILSVKVDYDRAKLSTQDILKAKATMKYSGKTATYQVIVDLPIPPGFTVDGGDFAEMVASKKIERFSATARQVTLYVGSIQPGSEHVFEYSLKPKYPVKAQAPAATAYEYYTPSNRAVGVPVSLEVVEKK